MSFDLVVFAHAFMTMSAILGFGVLAFEAGYWVARRVGLAARCEHRDSK